MNLNDEKDMVEKQERARIASECVKYEDCLREHVTIMRPGKLCSCFEAARDNILAADAGVARFIRDFPLEYVWAREVTGSLFVYADTISHTRDFIATWIAEKLNFHNRGFFASIDEIYYLVDEKNPDIVSRILDRSLLGLYGFGLGASMPRRFPGLLHLRRRKGLLGVFGISGRDFTELSEWEQRALSVYRDDFKELLL